MSATHPQPAESAPDRLLALADRCVQCGLCLPACPTYALDRTETESPRGRIALARAWTLGTVAPTPAGDRHLDHCLGCRSCEAVCPAGVEYGELLVEVRTRQRARRASPWRQRVIEKLASQPLLLRRLLGLYRHLFPVLPAALRRLPRPAAPPRPTSPPTARPSTPDTAALFIGCVAQPYETGLRDALGQLCAAAGVALAIPGQQGCCGALHAHAGNTAERERLAARNRAAFSAAGTVVTLASGCHEAVADSLRGVATVDAIAYLHRRASALRFRRCDERVALHLPCTQRSVVKSVAALRALLAQVPGLQVVELSAGHGCCGAAGTQMLLDPARADAYRAPLIEQFERSGASRLLSANIGCRLHLANATRMPVEHPLELLARCLA